MLNPSSCLPTRLPSRQEVQAVAAAWEAFMAGELHGVENLRPSIRASWDRCRQLGVNPQQSRLPLLLTASDIESQQERTDLVTLATSLFATVTQAWEEERYVLYVSDRQGHILYTDGHAQVLAHARQLNAIPGGGMAEEHIGTASANVVIAQGQTGYVMWHEHFSQAFHSWAGIGAPIFHPLTRELIGVAGACGEELVHPRALELIQRIASRIEQLLHHEEMVRRVALLDAYHQFVLRHPADGVLAIDSRGYICALTPTMATYVKEPQGLLEKSLLRLAEFSTVGFRAVAQQSALPSYDVRLTRLVDRLTMEATAIPVHGARQQAGTLLVLAQSTRIRPDRGAIPSPWRATHTFADLIGESAIFQERVALARQASQSDFPVLLTGETGTGKELFAQAIHTASARSQGPFVAVNCGIPSDELLAADLFGYVEGAFTGATKGGRKGKIELAQGGTLFLDEVEAMSPKMQVSLLRVLEEQQIVRIGSERPVYVDLRVIAAANEDLRAAADHKRFRADLYHRLCVLPIDLPPLREHPDDLPLLVRHLLRQLGFPHLHPTAETLHLLRRYPWPGNVRELKHVLLRAAQQTTGPTLPPLSLPPELRTTPSSLPGPTAKSLRRNERDLILQALNNTQGSLTQAAAQLGIHRVTLYRKLKRYGLTSFSAPHMAR